MIPTPGWFVQVRNIWLGYWEQCDAGLAKELRSQCEEQKLLSSEE